PAAPLSLLRARGQCGSLLHPRRLRFSVAPVAAAKPEAVGTTGEAAAAPVKELAKSLQGVELFNLRGKAVPVVDLWKDRNFLSCFGRLIVFETIDDGCLHVCALP
ncbi:Os01g0929967, partial [Oryza sativa Japonica Group]